MLKGKSKVNTETRREQITQAVFDLIADEGIRGITTSAIGRKIGTSEANLYRHYRNKSAILMSAVDRIGNGLIQNLEKLRDGQRPLEKLKKLFLLHLEFIQSNPGIPRLIFSEEIHQGPELRKKLLIFINTYTEGIQKLVIEGQQKGVIERRIDPQALSLSFIGIIQIITIKWSLTDFSFDLKKAGLKLWKNFELCVSEK